MRQPLLFCLSICAFLPGIHTLAAAEVFSPEHVARLRAVTEAKISPDGHHVAYVLGVPRRPGDEPSGEAWTELHVVFPSGVSRPFVTGEVNVGGIAWVPGRSSLSFLAKRGKDKTRSLYSIPIDGGEAQPILSFKTDLQSYTWCADGRRLAFLADEPPAEREEKLREKGFNADVYEETMRKLRVWIAETGENAAAPRALELDGSPSDIAWSPVGNELVLALAPTRLVDDNFMARRVHVVAADSGKVLARFDNPGKLGAMSWSPDGKRLAVIAAEDVHDPSAGRLRVATIEGARFEQLLQGFEGEFTAVAWKDASTIVYAADVGSTTSLGEIRVDGSGHAVRIAPGTVALTGVSLSADGRTIATLGESPQYPPEVHVFSVGNHLPRRMTSSNPWLEGMRFASQEIVRFKARDGLELEGILIQPLDVEKGKRYPLLLSVHGGPEAHERHGWLTNYSRPGQVAAARGFAVFYPNYRGSTGRGVAFSKLGQGDPAGKEFDDLVDAVDHLVATGLVERSKVGITGGSYGGYASAWGATKLTERFAASVMFVGISDLISKAGTTDIPNEERLVHARRQVHDGHWMQFLERSPIFHAKDARTPILILHGKDDPRVHPGQSLELYRYLKVVGKAPVRLVLYPGEGHGNRMSAARLDYHLRMLGWFEHYLKGPGGAPPGNELEYPFLKEAEKSTAEKGPATQKL